MPRPRALLAALAAAVALAASTVPAEARPAAPVPPQPSIVGGSEAGANQFPWVAALVSRSAATRKDGFTCGATILSRSWALTAAHCVLDYFDDYPDSRYGDYVAPTAFALVTGTRSLAQDGGGQRLNVARIVPYPTFDPKTFHADYALLRLAAPTTAPAVALIGSSAAELALDDPGTTQTAIGWGTLSETDGTLPTYQRFVALPMQSDATCAKAYPPSGTGSDGAAMVYEAAVMLCAGPLAGGRDTCSGDSGGPLAIQAGDGTWRQVGVTSFGEGCAEPGFPGIYSRLSAVTSWVSRTRRFGPFDPDGLAFVAQQYRDFVGRTPTGAEASRWLQRLADEPPATLIDAFESGDAWQGTGWTVTRLYLAAFLRTPDPSGLAHWIASRWAGKGPVSIANVFASSSEFRRRYGTLDDGGYVDRIYQNVFGRSPDPAGRDYWVRKLGAGTGRGQVLYELSNSNEYRTKTAADVRVITTRFALLRQTPTSLELEASKALSARELIDSLRTSYRYASRLAA